MKSNSVFSEINGRFGFGFMRLPTRDGVIDTSAVSEMVDAYIKAGFNYFDTAHGYHDGHSEKAIRECLTSRYSRDQYILANKLTDTFFKTEEEVRPVFEEQLKLCGVDYFDFYLMHCQNRRLFRHFQNCRAYETAFALKEEGKIRHVGISFHDKADVLEEILTAYPEIEFVQIQFNYYDYGDASVESDKVYEMCRKFGKPVIVMEPVKGGRLAKLPPDTEEYLRALDEVKRTNASYALRFAAGFDGVFMVLSGMGDMEMVRDNLATMRDPEPLNADEMDAIRKVRAAVVKKGGISCTSCHYCTAGCPKKIRIPDAFAAVNEYRVFKGWNSKYYYRHVLTTPETRASACIKCGACEQACPQHLPIRRLLSEIAEMWDTDHK